MQLHLVQRGIFKTNKNIHGEPKEITGVDSIIAWDYMGAAEYEFGTLPASLKRIVSNHQKKQLEQHALVIKEKPFVLFWSKSRAGDLEELQAILTKLADDPYSQSIKMGSHFDRYFLGPTETRLKRGCKKKTEEVNRIGYCDFWWDCENDWFLVPLEDDRREKVIKALDALVKKGYHKK